jgi:hypothetical protein
VLYILGFLDYFRSVKILVTGSSGLVGQVLVRSLLGCGHVVFRLLRPESRLQPEDAGDQGVRLLWNPATGELDGRAAGAEAVVHLAGEPIVFGRWNDRRKEQLQASRVIATRHLVSAILRLQPRPRIFVCASAVGYYGSRGHEELSESSPPGADFLAKLCQAWEAEAARAETFGLRAAELRFGMILTRHGGALGRMLLPFRLGLGGRFGSGRQWMSWLTLDEAVSMIRFVLENDEAHGPINAVSPAPVRNAEFTDALARALHRPAILPVPALALRIALGEMARPLLLASQRVLPRRLTALGYRFLHPELPPALAALLSTSGAS